MSIPTSSAKKTRVVILHGAGYAGLELYRILLRHPQLEIQAVTSRSQAGRPLAAVDTSLRGITEQCFEDEAALDWDQVDVVFSCAEHGASAARLGALLDAGFGGIIIDLSADFRLDDAADYPKYYGFEHPAPHWLPEFAYGLVEARTPYAEGQRLIANPGCFATGIALACRPVATRLESITLGVTALTGATGSGSRAKQATHYPARDNNVTAYRVLKHQHQAEIQQVLPRTTRLAMVPASGPWSRGIWGTVHFQLPGGLDQQAIGDWFREDYQNCPLVRLQDGALPVLKDVVHSSFCDLGWVVHDGQAVLGFAIDNLLKGAASQAVQNLNLLLGWPQTLALVEAKALT
jgi:N-acetyl-gamma-glutamyl-phosphate/LysW-gamma-L-alpha-aminoadipyl-6-phosphate reductase